LRGGVTDGVALTLNELLPISVPGSSQPCTTLGVHPRLTAVRRLYNEGDVAFLTNVGALVEPMTKAEYMARQKQRPPSLFAHNVQQKVTQSMHPQDNVATGVLGRIVDVLNRGGGAAAAYRTGTYSLDGMVKILEGERAPIVLDRSGVVSFAHQAEMQDAISNITLGGEQSYKSIFGETWAKELQDSLSTSQTLSAATSGVSLSATFPTDALGQQFEQVARVIAARSNLQEERQVFCDAWWLRHALLAQRHCRLQVPLDERGPRSLRDRDEGAGRLAGHRPSHLLRLWAHLRLQRRRN